MLNIPESSTQVYWLELEIESSVYNNITKLLQLLPQIYINNATVTDISITTGKQTYNEKLSTTFVNLMDIPLTKSTSQCKVYFKTGVKPVLKIASYEHGCKSAYKMQIK